jgi:hypothetical protein
VPEPRARRRVVDEAEIDRLLQRARVYAGYMVACHMEPPVGRDEISVMDFAELCAFERQYAAEAPPPMARLFREVLDELDGLLGR